MAHALFVTVPYVGETGGPNVAIEQDGALTYTSIGWPDRAAAFARRVGASYEPGRVT